MVLRKRVSGLFTKKFFSKMKGGKYKKLKTNEVQEGVTITLVFHSTMLKYSYF